jgi:dihydrofolate reductase
MAKLLYSATMSLDGFIAGPGGDMSWLTQHIGPNRQVEELIPRIGSIIVGRRSFVGDDPHAGEKGAGEPFGGGWEGPQFVLTHRPPAEPVAGIEFVTDLADCVARAREAAGEKYVNIIGADVARQCLEAGELDEVLAIVAPVFLGDGTRLFEHQGGAEHLLERTDVATEPSGVNLWFRPVY